MSPLSFSERMNKGGKGREGREEGGKGREGGMEVGGVGVGWGGGKKRGMEGRGVRVVGEGRGGAGG